MPRDGGAAALGDMPDVGAGVGAAAGCRWAVLCWPCCLGRVRQRPAVGCVSSRVAWPSAPSLSMSMSASSQGDFASGVLHVFTHARSMEISIEAGMLFRGNEPCLQVAVARVGCGLRHYIEQCRRDAIYEAPEI
jgi:hypothetical protein